VQKNVMTVLSQMLVKGEAGEGSAIYIDATDDKKGLKYEVVDPRGKSRVQELPSDCDDQANVRAGTNPAIHGGDEGEGRQWLTHGGLEGEGRR
jgi:hypothetical protein